MGKKLAILNSHPIQYFAPLYRRIAEESGIDLTVYFCSRKGVDLYQDEEFGVEVEWDVPLLEGYESRFLPNVRDHPGRDGYFFSLINPGIVSELWREKYDALWVHGYYYATYLLAIAAAKCVGTSVLMRCETHLLLDRPAEGIKRKIREPLLRGLLSRVCDGCLPIGSRNAEYYRQRGVMEERLFRVPYTVNNDYFWTESKPSRENPKQARDEFALPPDVPLILYASKMTKRKRPMDLLRAFEQIRSRDIKAGLVFAGDGSEMNRLQSYVRENEIPGVFFLGFLNQSALPKIYGACDVFVLPSENEPWGLVINEAMAAGLPVVASEEIGAVGDLVEHGRNGFTFEAGDTAALADSLHEVVSNEKRRKRMSEESMDIIRGWSYEECVEGIQDALQAVA